MTLDVFLCIGNPYVPGGVTSWRATADNTLSLQRGDTVVATVSDVEDVLALVTELRVGPHPAAILWAPDDLVLASGLDESRFWRRAVPVTGTHGETVGVFLDPDGDGRDAMCVVDLWPTDGEQQWMLDADPYLFDLPRLPLHPIVDGTAGDGRPSVIDIDRWRLRRETGRAGR